MNEKDLVYINEELNNAFRETKISVKIENKINYEDLLEKIKKFSLKDGWVSFQSKSAVRINDFQIEKNGQYIIAGEFINSDGMSMSVKFDGENWKIIEVSESNEGTYSVLCKTVKQLSKINEKTFITYRVYYKNEEGIGYRPFVSVFDGFVEEKK